MLEEDIRLRTANTFGLPDSIPTPRASIQPLLVNYGYSLVPKERHVRKEGNGSTLWLSNGPKESHDSTLEKNIVPKESHDCSFSLT